MKPVARITFKPSLQAERMACNFVKMAGIGKEIDTSVTSDTEYQIQHESGIVRSRVLESKEVELTVYK